MYNNKIIISISYSYIENINKYILKIIIIIFFTFAELLKNLLKLKILYFENAMVNLVEIEIYLHMTQLAILYIFS